MRAQQGYLVAVWALLACACNSGGASGSAAEEPMLSPTILVPEDLIHSIQRFELKVYASRSEAGVTVSCDDMTGALAGQVDAGVPEVDDQSFSGPCDGGSRCATTKVPILASGVPQVFVVLGYALPPGGGTTVKGPLIATGCTSQVITAANADAAATPQPITITLHAIIPASSCGNGVIEVGETCDPGSGSDPLCVSCQTVEEVLSVGSSATNTVPMPGAGHVSNPAFAWPAGADFLASFTDNSSAQSQVELRLMGTSLAADAMNAGAAQGAEFILPNASASGSADGFSTNAAADQRQPQTVIIGSSAYTVFADNSSGDGSYDIHLRSTDLGLLLNDQNSPCGINGSGGGGESGDQSFPQMALSNGNLFIAWQESSGAIAGRIYTPSGTGACGILGAQVTIGTPGSTNVSIAGIPSGWIAAWQNGAIIQSQAIRTNGTLVGTPAPVNSSTDAVDSPMVASIPPGNPNAGAFAIAWSDKTSGKIVAQRYQLVMVMGMPEANVIGGDQGAASLDNLVPGSSASPSSAPFIAWSSQAGGSYVVTWIDGTSNNAVHARLLAGVAGDLQHTTGYLFNGITGLTDEFQVSTAATNGDARNSAVVAVGGKGPYMAFGWVDTSSKDNYGVIGRRFPLPSQNPTQ